MISYRYGYLARSMRNMENYCGNAIAFTYFEIHCGHLEAACFMDFTEEILRALILGILEYLSGGSNLYHGSAF
jgi:hypothetical protein